MDLFFALSGYLITGLLLREVGDRPRVAGRVLGWPVPAIAAGARDRARVVTVVVWARAPRSGRSTLADGPWVQLNLVNWHLLAESAGYWDRFGAARVFGHLWSIAVEEQFYLVWPVFVRLVARWGRGRTGGRGGGRAGLGGLAGADGRAGRPGRPDRVYTGTDTRASSLLLGALVATPPVRAGSPAGRREVGGCRGAVLAAGMGARGPGRRLASAWLFTGGLFAHSVAAAALIGLCAHAPCPRAPGPCVASAAVARAPSYGLYLWHWPVFVLLSADRPARRAGGGRGRGVVGALAALSTHLVEDPIRFRARWARGLAGCWRSARRWLALAVLWLALPAPAAPASTSTGWTDHPINGHLRGRRLRLRRVNTIHPVSTDPPLCTWAASAVHTIWSTPSG